MPEERVLVTGGAGFIGSHVVERLLAAGADVCVLDNFATGRRENLAGVLDAIELIEGDVDSYERAQAAVEGCDVVIHEAALPSVVRSIEDPGAVAQVNVMGSLNILIAARDAGVRRVLLASSSSVYGVDAALPKREGQAPDPVSPYAVSKLAAEKYCRSFTQVYGLDTVILRYFNVFGPRQDPFSDYAAVVPRFIMASLRGEPPTVYGDGEQSRDFTYVDNVVDGTILAMEAPAAARRVFNVAAGEATTVNGLIRALEHLTGATIEPIRRDGRPGEVRHSQASVEEARRVLGFEPQVDFIEGLARTVEFFSTRQARSRLRATSGT